MATVEAVASWTRVTYFSLVKWTGMRHLTLLWYPWDENVIKQLIGCMYVSASHQAPLRICAEEMPRDNGH